MGGFHIRITPIPHWSFPSRPTILSSIFKSVFVNARGACLSLMLTGVLWGCDSQTSKMEAIESQSKVLICSLNASPLKIEITKGSLDATLLYDGKESKINLLEVKDFYQIIMRFDPQIGQLKINKMGNELTQLKSGNEQVATCLIEMR